MKRASRGQCVVDSLPSQIPSHSHTQTHTLCRSASHGAGEFAASASLDVGKVDRRSRPDVVRLQLAIRFVCVRQCV